MNGTTEDRVWGVMERVTRLETLLESHVKQSGDFRVQTAEHLEEMDGKMAAIASKLDAIVHKMTVAETQVQTTAGIVGWILKNVPGFSIGGIAAWAATHFWPGGK